MWSVRGFCFQYSFDLQNAEARGELKAGLQKNQKEVARAARKRRKVCIIPYQHQCTLAC